MTPDVVVGVAVRMFVWRSLVILKFLFCFVLFCLGLGIVTSFFGLLLLVC